MSSIPNTEIDAETISQLAQDEMVFGVSFRKTNPDGSWTRISPENVYMPAPDDELVAAGWRVANKAPDGLMYSQYLKIAQAAAAAIGTAKAEGDHFLRYFEKLAREHPSASAALDTARREWEAKKGEAA